MTHIAFQPKENGNDVALDTDWVIVGSGAGGASAAVALARAGESVIVVEAGAWRDPKDYPSTTFGAMRDMADNWTTTLARKRAFWPVVQARCVGGTTVINSAIIVRTPGDIFRQWEAEHGFGGDTMAASIGAIQDDLDRELFVSEAPPESRGRSNELAKLADDALGFKGHYMRRSVRDCLGKGQCFQGCKAGRKQSTNLNFIPETRRLGGTVLSCAPVERVIFEGARAIGVRGRFQHPQTKARGAAFEVRARRGVLMAASVTHSAPILQRSGVRMPALGQGFRAHPGTGVFGVYDDPVQMNTGATQGWASINFRTDPGLKLETLAIPPELVAGRLAGGGRQLMERIKEIPHLAMWVMAVRAESVGTVKPGLFGGVSVKYGLDRRDMERMRTGAYLVAQMHVAAGAKRIIPGISGMPYSLKPNEIGAFKDAPLDPRRWVAILSHLFGGCTMGSDPKRSVCAPSGQVHGHPGLYIVDASLIPTNLGVNPQHTIMALARHIVQGLLKE